MIKKSLKYFIVLMSLGNMAYADPGDGGYIGSRRHNLANLTKELSLTAEQKNELEAVFKEEHEKIRAINEQSHQQIKQVLSGEQAEKWEQIISQRREKRQRKQED